MSIARTTALSRPDRLRRPPAYPNRLRFADPPPLFLRLSSRDLRLRPRPVRMAAAPPNLSGDSINDENRRRNVPGLLSLDELLTVAEVVCVTPPIMCSVYGLVSPVLPEASKHLQVSFGSKIFVLQYFLLVGAVVIGCLIRWRQWRRIYRVNDSGMGVSLIGRIDMVEEDIRSSATVIRVLSRHLEKLGTRFRLSRKTLKEPIITTAALAQKNSEATRALAIQEEILEKEIREIQKVLLAMQEQQLKQLELILAIGKRHSLEGSSGNSNPISVKKDMELETQSARNVG